MSEKLAKCGMVAEMKDGKCATSVTKILMMILSIAIFAVILISILVIVDVINIDWLESIAEITIYFGGIIALFIMAVWILIRLRK